jgi:ADP-ribose pyrophosphatase YjhB (NUDIX family)
MEGQWLSWVKRLHAIASTGLHYSQGDYDRERFQEVATIAGDMLAALAATPIPGFEKLDADFGFGYATPKVDVRGAVFRDDNILLVRERSDGLWTLPGGFADVGVSPSENVIKEIWEEASLNVTATTLYAVRHKARHEYSPDVLDLYKFFFLCERVDDAEPKPGLETADARFFGRNEIPPLSRGRTLEKDIAAAFAVRDNPQSATRFD